jgi:hypothetical protein
MPSGSATNACAGHGRWQPAPSASRIIRVACTYHIGSPFDAPVRCTRCPDLDSQRLVQYRRDVHADWRISRDGPTSDHHAARLMFQGMSEPSADYERMSVARSLPPLGCRSPRSARLQQAGPEGSFQYKTADLAPWPGPAIITVRDSRSRGEETDRRLFADLELACLADEGARIIVIWMARGRRFLLLVLSAPTAVNGIAVALTAPCLCAA